MDVSAEKRKAYQQKLQAQMDEWAAQMEVLRAKADKAEASAKAAYYRSLEDLEGRMGEAKSRMKALAEASDAAWEEIQEGAEKAWGDLKDAFRSAVARFKD